MLSVFVVVLCLCLDTPLPPPFDAARSQDAFFATTKAVCSAAVSLPHGFGRKDNDPSLHFMDESS